uniref:Metallo-beta-lactamase domain-containing protein n=1 Tax=Arcella intermedia TaxID=1963864 RepID=A0A6B2LK22_9EUKA
MSAPTTGRVITILGDTSDPSAITGSALRSDLLVHEATFDASLEGRAVKAGHSTTLMAAEFARKVNARRLVITHFSARYDNPHGSHDKEMNVDKLLEETQKACPEIEVIAAKDFLEIEVKKVN